MTVSVPDEGEEAIIDDILSFDHTLHLFKNNVTPGNATVLGDLVEAAFTGYSSKTLTGGSWTTTPGAPSYATYVPQTFTCTAAGTPETIYGYWIERGGKIRFIERYPTADIRAISAANQTRIVNPRITLSDEGD